jgi:rSAM/selenodomain-associated transferase 2
MGGGPGPAGPELSVIVPVLNDADSLRALLAWLAGARDTHVEVIVVDGGSTDGSIEVARAGGANRILQGVRGRGAQLALGCSASQGRWVWLLHADSMPALGCLDFLRALGPEPGWGRFDVRLAGPPMLRIVAAMMNLRSCLTGICTGDQGIFVHRDLLDAVGGMPTQPLMEDIELSRRLKRLRRPWCRHERIGSSPRRWLRGGVARTILSMWRFRLRYWLGADPERLAREYYR